LPYIPDHPVVEQIGHDTAFGGNVTTV